MPIKPPSFPSSGHPRRNQKHILQLTHKASDLLLVSITKGPLSSAFAHQICPPILILGDCKADGPPILGGCAPDRPFDLRRSSTTERLHPIVSQYILYIHTCSPPFSSLRSSTPANLLSPCGHRASAMLTSATSAATDDGTGGRAPQKSRRSMR